MTSESKRHPVLYVLISTLILAACGGDGSKKFASCADAEKAGYTSMKKGEDGYSAKLDGDGDGVACDKQP